MYLPNFQYLRPETEDQLMATLAEHGEKARVLAGGTDLLPMMKEKKVQPAFLINIEGLEFLHGIAYEEGKGLVIGSATNIEAVENSSIIRRKYHALYQGSAAIGSPQVRAMGTIGGNCCNALPAADTPPPLIAFGARVRLVSKRGRREMPLEEFILGNRVTAIEQDEFMESLLLPEPWPNSSSRYHYMALRGAMEIDMVSVAVNLALDPSDGKVNHVGIVLGAVAPTPMRARKAEEILLGKDPNDDEIGKAAGACAEESRPIDDFRASAAYRGEMVKVLAKRCLKETWASIVPHN